MPAQGVCRPRKANKKTLKPAGGFRAIVSAMWSLPLSPQAPNNNHDADANLASIFAAVRVFRASGHESFLFSVKVSLRHSRTSVNGRRFGAMVAVWSAAPPTLVRFFRAWVKWALLRFFAACTSGRAIYEWQPFGGSGDCACCCHPPDYLLFVSGHRLSAISSVSSSCRAAATRHPCTRRDTAKTTSGSERSCRHGSPATCWFLYRALAHHAEKCPERASISAIRCTYRELFRARQGYNCRQCIADCGLRRGISSIGRCG